MEAEKLNRKATKAWVNRSSIVFSSKFLATKDKRRRTNMFLSATIIDTRVCLVKFLVQR